MFSHERLDAILRARVPRPIPLTAAADSINRRLRKRVDGVVVASEFAAAEFARAGIVDVHRVPLGVDLQTFHPAGQHGRALHSGPTRGAGHVEPAVHREVPRARGRRPAAPDPDRCAGAAHDHRRRTAAVPHRAARLGPAGHVSRPCLRSRRRGAARRKRRRRTRTLVGRDVRARHAGGAGLRHAGRRAHRGRAARAGARPGRRCRSASRLRWRLPMACARCSPCPKPSDARRPGRWRSSSRGR